MFRRIRTPSGQGTQARLKLPRVDPVRVHDSARDGVVEQFGEGRVTETSGHWHVLYAVWPPGLDDHSTGCYL